MYFIQVSLILITISSTRAFEEDNNCTLSRDNLANAISNFTSCAIENSRPITLCEMCVDDYLNLTNAYANLSLTKNTNGHYCIEEYVNLDRLQIVENLYKSSNDLWIRAKCYECFEIVNNSLTHNRSKETIMFNLLLNDTFNCINATNNNESVFCDRCIDEYLGLNSYYISISNINERIGVCMDIVDLMNETRSLWSKKCCNYRKKNEFIFLASTGLVTLITILFYLLAKYCTDMKKPEILKQSRFAESLNQLNQ